MSTMIDPSSLLIGVVAHRSRLRMAEALAEKTQAQVLNVDQTNASNQDDSVTACAANHLTVLRRLQSMVAGDTWCIILEDDAQPIDDFRVHAAAALKHAPTHLVGFYIGRAGNIEALQTAQSLDRAWVMADYMISAVAYAVRADILTDLLADYPRYGPTPTPEVRFTDWCRSKGWWFCYTVPSLVDHNDGDSLIFTENNTYEIRQMRKAWRVGVANNWNTTILTY